MATDDKGNPLLSPKEKKSDDSDRSAELDVTEEEEEGQGGPGAAKTPVSLLQELYVRRGITPKYDLVQIEGAVHEPTFKYRVTVGEFVATGCGQSKKKAKHCAAKSILDKLIGAQNSGQAAPGQPAIPDLANEILSPYDDGVQGNPVGTLQEVCMNRRWPPPTYDLSNEEGLPHERSFTIVCIIGKFRETGSGKSKKLAKRQAANKMLGKLKDLPVENEEGFQNIDDDELAQGLAHRYSALKDETDASDTEDFNHELQRVIDEETHRVISDCLESSFLRPPQGFVKEETLRDISDWSTNDGSTNEESDDELDLTGIDDDEISSYILSDNEIRLKTNLCEREEMIAAGIEPTKKRKVDEDPPIM